MRLFKEVNVRDKMEKPTRKAFKFNMALLKRTLSGSFRRQNQFKQERIESIVHKN